MCTCKCIKHELVCMYISTKHHLIQRIFPLVIKLLPPLSLWSGGWRVCHLVSYKHLHTQTYAHKTNDHNHDNPIKQILFYFLFNCANDVHRCMCMRCVNMFITFLQISNTSRNRITYTVPSTLKAIVVRSKTENENKSPLKKGYSGWYKNSH